MDTHWKACNYSITPTTWSEFMNELPGVVKVSPKRTKLSPCSLSLEGFTHASFAVGSAEDLVFGRLVRVLFSSLWDVGGFGSKEKSPVRALTWAHPQCV